MYDWVRGPGTYSSVPKWIGVVSKSSWHLQPSIWICAGILLALSGFFAARRQLWALLIATCCTAVTWFLYHTTAVVLFLMKLSPDPNYDPDLLRYQLRDFQFSTGWTWILFSVIQLKSISLLIAILPPAPKFAAWRPTPDWPARIIALGLLFSFWLMSVAMIVYELNADEINSGTNSLPNTILDVLGLFLGYPSDALRVAAIVLLVMIYRRARRYIPSPNRCFVCNYKLDTHMTLCPECGHTRAPHNPPQPKR